jgi:predicted secreted acid phosphatase
MSSPVAHMYASNSKALEAGLDVLKGLSSQLRGNPRLNAIVLDIDGTALYNCGGRPPMGQASLRKEYCRRNPGLHKIYEYAIKQGIAVFFVTARPDDRRGENRAITEQELRAGGFAQFQQLIMRNERNLTENGSDYSRYKAQARRTIARDYNLLLNIGDSHADMVPFPKEGRPARLTAAQTQVLQCKVDRAYILVFEDQTPNINIKLKNEK